MTSSPHWSDLVQLYQQVLTTLTMVYLEKESKVKKHRSVYPSQVVIWLMMLQRLQQEGTLASAVQLLLNGASDALLQDCLRVRQRRISARTGAYCRARQKLPALLCRNVNREITGKLRALLDPGEPEKPRIYLVDGSSLELEHSPDLLKHYPAAKNQFGLSHWPVLRLVVLHDLETGLAEEPQWGAAFGPPAVSEQQLAERALDRLPPSSVILGDRNFGVCWMAYAAQQRQLGVLLRLTDVRAEKLMGGPIKQATDQPIVWKASRWDGGKHHCLPPGATVKGRFIAVPLGAGRSKEWLYLFTTLDSSVEEIAALYGQRWHIETDLRALKRTVRLQHISVKSNDMLEKELLLAVCAYNLVRATMCLAARKSQRHPRQLSFAMVLNVVNAAGHKLLAATTPQLFQKELDRILDIAAQCTLPNRKKPRSFPRLLWRHAPGFPFYKSKSK
jgi:putative transposase